mmetsp:Transcript_17780/g.58505  ORF Transcript_17780/g.58505 Transcript_17780/m.58505 type:complete len:220 (+) Transcript_17780:687-1346(+)
MRLLGPSSRSQVWTATATPFRSRGCRWGERSCCSLCGEAMGTRSFLPFLTPARPACASPTRPGTETSSSPPGRSSRNFWARTRLLFSRWLEVRRWRSHTASGGGEWRTSRAVCPDHARMIESCWETGCFRRVLLCSAGNRRGSRRFFLHLATPTMLSANLEILLPSLAMSRDSPSSAESRSSTSIVLPSSFLFPSGGHRRPSSWCSTLAPRSSASGRQR